MGLSNSINWCMGHRSAYCGNHFPFAFIPIIPETPFLTQLLDHVGSVNNGTIDTSAAVALEADVSRDPTAIWHLPCSYFTGCPWISLSVLAIIPRYSGHCIWDSKSGTRRKRGSSSSVYLYNNPMFFHMMQSVMPNICHIYTVTMSKRVESHPGLSSEFWQRRFSVQMGSCDPFAKIPADRARQKLSIVTPKTKGCSFKLTAVSTYYLFAEFRSTALLCGMIHYTNSSSYHADVQLSRLTKGDQWWWPLWEHWCINTMHTGNGNLVCWPTGRSRYFLWARQVREKADQCFEQRTVSCWWS